MTVVGTTRASRLGGRVNLENNTPDFLPISIGFFGIEQTHIGDCVLLVVRCQRWLVWRCVCHFGIERRHYRKLLSALEVRPRKCWAPSSREPLQWSTGLWTTNINQFVEARGFTLEVMGEVQPVMEPLHKCSL